jgi:hypothetical protein
MTVVQLQAVAAHPIAAYKRTATGKAKWKICCNGQSYTISSKEIRVYKKRLKERITNDRVKLTHFLSKINSHCIHWELLQERTYINNGQYNEVELRRKSSIPVQQGLRWQRVNSHQHTNLPANMNAQLWSSEENIWNQFRNLKTQREKEAKVGRLAIWIH